MITNSKVNEETQSFIESDISDSTIEGNFFFGESKIIGSNLNGCGTICNATFINCKLNGEFSIHGHEGTVYENLDLHGYYIIEGDKIEKVK